jgi:hypothetical protein
VGPRRAAHPTNTASARRITGQITAGLAPGSYLIISTGQLEGDTGHEFSQQYSAGNLHHHTRDEVAGFLAGLELIDPGVTEGRAWRALALLPADPRPGHIWAAVGRTPAGKTARS